MTDPVQPAPLALPVSALLAPQSAAPHDILSTPLALLGPLPPTTPIHLALNYLYLCSLPEFGADDNEESQRKIRHRDKVLIITGPKEDYANAIEEEDEDYIRDKGADYEILDGLKRVDIRYCPNIKHVMLLLSLLTQERSNTSEPTGTQPQPQNLGYRPGMVIMWNTGSLLMEVDEANENENKHAKRLEEGDDYDSMGKGGSRMKFRSGVVISDYLEVVAAARAAVDHLSLDKSESQPNLIVLEPEMTPDSSLPIFPPNSLAGEDIPKQSRERRIKIQTGLERILGHNTTGGIVPAHVDIDDGSAVYTMSIPDGPDEGFSIRRRHCPRGAWGSAGVGRVVDVEGLPVAEGDPGGWRWEWT